MSRFAVGNAAFHSALLYPHLAPAIGPLVDLLSDSEEKTRANAAGALGNLVRNSSELCGQMIAAGVLDALLALVPRAREIRTRGASCGNHQDCSSPDVADPHSHGRGLWRRRYATDAIMCCCGIGNRSLPAKSFSTCVKNHLHVVWYTHRIGPPRGGHDHGHLPGAKGSPSMVFLDFPTIFIDFLFFQRFSA